MIGIPGPTLDRPTRAFLAEHPPGGVILFKRNIRSASQLHTLVAELHETGSGLPPLVALDHEGGRVDRLRRRPFTHFPPAAVVGARNDPRLAAAVGRAMGRELRAVGIDLDFAPVLDVWSNPRNRVIGDRAFGTTPARVARLALAFARGLMDAGVLACGKHFPGHGATTGDSHFVLPRDRRPRRAIVADYLPFVRAVRADLPAILTAHVVFPALDPRRPATLSEVICRGLLRRRLGFRGAIFTDDLDMMAIAARATPDRTAVAALTAGCDMLLFCQSLATARTAMRGVEAALATGKLPPENVATSLARIQGLRRRLRPIPRQAILSWPTHARLVQRLTAPA
jgi:beta-N-acetylhexosaminidase